MNVWDLSELLSTSKLARNFQIIVDMGKYYDPMYLSFYPM